MNKIQTFDFESNQVRTVAGHDGEPWWVASDVCRVLALPNVGQAIARLDDDERRDDITISDAIGRSQKTCFINESGLYSLILRSRKPEAKRFKKWVTSVLLPAYRKGRVTIRDGEGDDPLLMSIGTIAELRRQQIALERRVDVVEQKVDKHCDLASTIALAVEIGLQVRNETRGLAGPGRRHDDDTGFVTLVGFTKSRGLKMSGAELGSHGRGLALHCKKAGIPVKKVASEKWGEKNIYPVAVLEQWFGGRLAPSAN